MVNPTAKKVEQIATYAIKEARNNPLPMANVQFMIAAEFEDVIKLLLNINETSFSTEDKQLRVNKVTTDLGIGHIKVK